MGEVLPTQTTVVVVFSAAAALAFAVTALIVGLVVWAAGLGGEDVIRDVQSYIELTEEARSTIPRSSLFADPNGETSAAIGRFLAKKEEARRALWASRQSRMQEQVTAGGWLEQPRTIPPAGKLDRQARVPISP